MNFPGRFDRTTGLGASVPEVIAHWMSRIRLLVDRRFKRLPTWVVLVEMFIGVGWSRAAIAKIVDGAWWNGTALERFISVHADQTLPWYRPVIDTVVAPNLFLIAVVVVVAQLVAGATLVAGRRRLLGLLVGGVLSLNFIAAGAVNPSIFYLISQAAVVLWFLEHRAFRRKARPILGVLTVISVTAAAVSVPFVSIFDPARVIEDPAAIFVFAGLLLGVSSDVARRRLDDRSRSPYEGSLRIPA